MSRPEPPPGAPLSEAERARGRRLAIVSHPFGMVHRMAFSEQLPTLALVALGASEALVGAQRFLVLLTVWLQLPTFALLGRVSKRRVLVLGQSGAVLVGLPLMLFATLADLGSGGLAIAMAGFALSTAGFAVSSTAWFPMLHGFVDPEATGRFFGLLRSGWHLTLIFYFLGACWWLDANPGAFGPLFGAALALGAVRIALVAQLPERSERTGEPLSLRAALRGVRARPGWWPYLAGTVLAGGARGVFITFAIVSMRRHLGFSDADVVLTTVATFAGGLASLYLWGRAVDALGPVPVFLWTAVGMAAAMLGFAGLDADAGAPVAPAVALFFALSVLASGFDVADTRVLFRLAPEETPARLLVPTAVANGALRGVLPLAAGLAVEAAFARGSGPGAVYDVLFVLLAALQLAAYGPLRRFRHGVP